MNNNPNQPNTRPCAPNAQNMSDRALQGAAMGALAGAKTGTPQGIAGGALFFGALGAAFGAKSDANAVKQCLDKQALKPKP